MTPDPADDLARAARWESVLSKLANGEHPYDETPFSARHVEVYRNDARDIIALLAAARAETGGSPEIEALRADVLAALGAGPDEDPVRMASFVREAADAFAARRDAGGAR